MSTDHRPLPSGLALTPAGDGDFEALFALRMAAMRESLERAGHFDPQRARERLCRGFLPAHTRHILQDGELVGFVVVHPRDEDWLLDHLYIHPNAQGQGIGSWVLEQVLRDADAKAKAVSVTALKHSAANRFYLRHGFVLQAEGEWDLYYRRPARQQGEPTVLPPAQRI
ncbi:GNAT family N-acetyltransferase [Piscinibacter sakaiensis]|uniref:GNAT family N-acetyltransferase n=1 Tax=Piscinibacter sakaiensis TaxID=1547922 RepID=UPI003AAABF1B